MLDQYIRTDATPYPGFSGARSSIVCGTVLGILTDGPDRWGRRSGGPRGPRVALRQGAAGPTGICPRGLARHGTTRPIPAGQRGPRARHRAPHRGARAHSLGACGGLLGDILVTLAGQPVADGETLLSGEIPSGERVGRPGRSGSSRWWHALATLEVTIGRAWSRPMSVLLDAQPRAPVALGLPPKRSAGSGPASYASAAEDQSRRGRRGLVAMICGDQPPRDRRRAPALRVVDTWLGHSMPREFLESSRRLISRCWTCPARAWPRR